MNDSSHKTPDDRGLCIGTWLSIGSPIIAELAAISGFDWLLFDFEHGSASDACLLSNLQAVRGTGARAIVRVASVQPEAIMRALDWGASGIMLPHVESVEDAEACLQAIHYAPRGCRGFSRSVRAQDYGLRSALDLPPIKFFAQIESLRGVEEVGNIAQIEGVDVLFVGPSDLARNIAITKDSDAATYEECLTRVLAAARSAGKKAGILVRDLEELPRVFEMGFTHVAVDSDISILRGSYQNLLKEARAL